MSTSLFRRWAALAALTLALGSHEAQLHAQGAGSGGRPLGAVLDRPSNFRFRHAHLQDVVETLRREFKLDVRLDVRALDDEGVSIDRAKSIRDHQREMLFLADNLANRLAGEGMQLAPDAELLRQIRALPYPGITFVQPEMTLRSALTLVLAEVDPSVTYVVHNDVLWITTREGAEKKVEVRVYPVADLARVPPVKMRAKATFDPIPQAAAPPYDYDSLIAILKDMVEPDSWIDNGGAGEARAGEQSLTIAQTSQRQETVRGLLAALRTVQTQMGKKKPDFTPIPVVLSAASAEREAAIEASLAKKGTIEFKNATLDEVASALSDRFGIPVRIERNALNEGGETQPSHGGAKQPAAARSTRRPGAPRFDTTANAGDEPLPTGITLKQNDISLRAALEMILDSVDPNLTYAVRDECLLITSKDAAKLRIVVYPVGDLIAGTSEGGYDFDSLISNIKQSIDADSWKDNGGPAEIKPYALGSALVIAQTDQVHHRIRELLGDLRKLAQQRKIAAPPKVENKEEADPYMTVVFLLWQPYRKEAIVKEEDLVKLLKETVEPASWKGPEVSVRTLPSRLIIRQRTSVHRKIYDALQSLAVLQPSPASLSPSAGMGGFGGGFGGGMGGFGGGGLGSAGSPGNAPVSGGFGGQAGTLPAAEK